MNSLCIVSCGYSKIWNKNPYVGPTKARYVYIGPFASKCKEYAEKFYPSTWCILSAKYGFLFPDDIIPKPYNVSFNRKKANPITTKELLSQMKRKKLNRYKKIVVLGGQNYTNIVKDVFYGIEIYSPLTNLKGIGYMMQKLKNAIENEHRS